MVDCWINAAEEKIKHTRVNVFYFSVIVADSVEQLEDFNQLFLNITDCYVRVTS